MIRFFLTLCFICVAVSAAVAQVGAPPGKVTIVPGVSLRGADGAPIDISRSQTGGFQEAVEASVAAKASLKLEGGPGCKMEWRATVKVPPLTNNTFWDVEPCDISYSGRGIAIEFDTMIHANIRWRAHLFHIGDSDGLPAVDFNPRNIVDDWGPFIIDSKIEWFRVTVLGRGMGSGVRFSAGGGSIQHASFEFVEIEGRSGNQVYMRDGVFVAHPASGFRFSGNWISVQRLQGFTGAGIRVGENLRPDRAGTIENNRFSAYIAPMHPNAAGFMSWGAYDLAQLHISNEIGPFATGIYLFEGQQSGVYMVPRNDGGQRLVDRSRLRNSIILSP